MDIFEPDFLFKGFIETQGKRSIEKFKGRTDFKTYEQVQSLPEFAGVLGDGIILVDLDDFDESEMLFNIIKAENINCIVTKTNKGKHFFFKNHLLLSNKTRCKTAVGLTADIKLGEKASYAVLKYQKQQREILYSSETIDTLPKWLLPIKTNMEFVNMEAGDGRNQALFNYILILQGNDFSVEESRETIRLINAYVLKDPLSDDELEVVLRDEAFAKPVFFKGATFLHDKFALFLKTNFHIIRMDGKLHIFQDGVYSTSLQKIERAMLKEIPSLTDAKRKEVLKYLSVICDDVFSADANLIAFRNGLFNVMDNSFIPFTPEHIITNKIDWDYNPKAYNELTDKTLNRIACGDTSIRHLLEEVVGACFYRSNTLAGGKAFIFTGEGSNGKSTFISVLHRILGDDNISALDLKNVGDRFSKATLYKKLANLGDDMSDDFISDPSLFKKIVTGDRIQAEEKGQEPFEFNPYCKLIFSANNVPRIRDKTGAVQRRLLIIPFHARFDDSDSDYDSQIKYKLQQQDSIEYLIQLGIQGLKRVLLNQKFTESEKVQSELDEYAKSNNPVLSFIEDCKESEVSIENEPVETVFRNYQEYCIRNNYQALAKNEFSKQVQRLMNLTTKRVGKKRTSVFIPLE